MEIKAEEMLYRLQQGQGGDDWPNVIALYGEEDFYRSQIAAALPEWVFSGVAAADREITVFDRDTDLRELAAAVNTYPFFCGRSLIVLKDERLLGKQEDESSKPLERLAEILGDVPEYCTLLLSVAKLDKRTRLFKLLKKQALLCECRGLRVYELAPWLERQAALYGARWEREAVGTVLEYLAPVERAPLQLLQQELEKLAVYAGGRTVWTKADVENIFAALPEASAFTVVNFIAEGRLAEALQQLSGERKKGTNILPVCAMIMFKLRQLLQFMELRRRGFDQKAIAAELKQSPYVVRRLQEQSRRFTEQALQEALLAITGLNIGLRRGGRSYARLEEILVTLLT